MCYSHCTVEGPVEDVATVGHARASDSPEPTNTMPQSNVTAKIDKEVSAKEDKEVSAKDRITIGAIYMAYQWP